MPLQRNALRVIAFALAAALAAAAALIAAPAPPAYGADRVVIAAGSFQTTQGCGENWDPACEDTRLFYTGEPNTYSAVFEIPAGNWEFKIALNAAWDGDYGLGGGFDNIPMNLAAPSEVRITTNTDTKVTDWELLAALDGYNPAVDDALIAPPARQAGGNENFYFVMTDRFNNADPSNDTGGVDPSEPRSVHGFDPTHERYYHGGDIAGLTEKLDYIQGLGTTAIWLTPSFENLAVQAVGTSDESAGYHGYWITNFLNMDPHLGSNDDLEELINEAHARGMKVYFDIITNHTADAIEYLEGADAYLSKADHPYRDADGNEFDPADYAGTGTFPDLDPAISFPYTPQHATGMETIKSPAWLNDVTLYHNRGNSTWEGESVTYGDFFGLDDLMTEHPDVVDGFVDIYKYWVDFGVDGFRIDTVKHVNFEFWEEWTTQILDHAHAQGNDDFFMFGEVYDADARLLSPYVRDTDMNSVLDFAFQSSAVNFARGNSPLGLSGLFSADDYYTTATKSADALPTFLGNHDMGRVAAFIEGSGDESDRTMLAHSLMYLTRGQPVVYYGDEQGIIGGTSPDTASRQSLFASQVESYQNTWTLHGYQLGQEDRFDTDVPMYEHIADLAALRTSSDALTQGAQIELYASGDSSIYAFARVDRDDKLEHVVALNNSTSQQSATFTTLTPGATYTTLWGDHANVTADANGEVTLTVDGLDAVVLLADQPVAAPADPVSLTVGPTAGSEVEGLVPVTADAPAHFWAETSFAFREVGTDDWTRLGTAEGDKPRVFHDVSDIAPGTELEYRAVYVDADDNRAAASTFVTVTESGPGSEPGSGDGFVTVPGSHNMVMGCANNWAPECADAALEPGVGGIFSKTFDLPAGTYEYKVAVGGSWDVNYGAGGYPDGDNVSYSHAGGPITFWFNPSTKHFINSAQSPIVTLAGSFQPHVGCDGDWEADCMATWMGLPDDNIYTYSTSAIPPGNYEVKVVHGLTWDESYGPPDNVGGNYSFSVTGDQLVVFRYDISTHVLTITEQEIPVEGEGIQGAYWIDETTIAWPPSLGSNTGTEEWTLHAAATGGLVRDGAAVTGSEQAFTLTRISGGLTEAQRAKFRHLSGHIALKVEDASRAQIEQILTGDFAVLQTLNDIPTAFTGLQIPGVLDDLYSASASARDLGVTWSGDVPTVALWAPTAKDVDLVLWNNGTGEGSGTTIDMVREEDGTWTVTGDADWKNRAYRFDVEVYVPSEGAVVVNEVTDPYSVGMAVDSSHSIMLDLNDPAWAPSTWTTAAQPNVRWVDQTIYELHVRDFSISDPTVPEHLRGTYKAFTVDSDGTQHLRDLAAAGMTTIHLLPTFDIGTIPEDRDDQVDPVIPNSGPASTDQQAAVAAARAGDGFNWGYDPLHYNVPEGSYASAGNQDGGDRVREYREMVGAIHDMGMQVVVDKVYNHTTASGQSELSVLDRVVPGYYHRLNSQGDVETSTCCDNLATEHDMMEKLMVDSVVLWAKHYKIDGFRFDLMGHHSQANMQAVRDALDALTVADDGVDGSSIYLYGEGWNFGEVANNARFDQASIGQLGGTGIGTFSDRLRDAVRGGSAFGDNKRWPQGFGSGLGTDPNEVAEGSEWDQLGNLAHQTDLVRLGMAGNLRNFEFATSSGAVLRGDQLDYNGQQAGYADSPEEVVSYVDKHDNETLFDILTLKLPVDTSMEDRVRMNHLSMATAALSQTPWFMHAGSDLLRSKSLDRNSYDSGDHFNRVDWSKQDNNFGVGLPPAWDNEGVWPQMTPLLNNPALKPAPADIQHSAELTQQLLELRFSTNLLRLGDAGLINQKISFPESGAGATPGLITMFIDDRLGADVDADLDSVLVVINASPTEIVENLPALAGRQLELSAIQADGVDQVVKATQWDADAGTVTIPARSVALLVEPTDAGPVAEISVARETVQAGSDVTVTGVGFDAEESIEVLLGDVVLGTATADADGAFVQAFTIPVDTLADHYVVTATGTESERSATADLEVTPAPVPAHITVSPETVQAGADVLVTGTGFDPEEVVEVALGAVVLGTATADADGAFTQSFTVAAGTDAGDYVVTATGADSVRSATAALEVTPAPVVPDAHIALSPDVVEAGQDVLVTGTGFDAEEGIEITMGSILLGTATADADGAFSRAVTVPAETTADDHVVTATGVGSERSATADLEVTAAPVVPDAHIVVSPVTVEAGSDVTVAGTGFDADESVEVTLGDAVLGSTTADADGAFSQAFTVSVDTAAGDYVVTATGAESERSATADLEVTAAPEPPAPHIAISPGTVEAGQTAVVSGTGFGPGDTIRVVLDGNEIATATATGSGEIVATITIPATTPTGNSTVSVTNSDGTTLASVVLAVTAPVVVDPDPEPTPEPKPEPEPKPATPSQPAPSDPPRRPATSGSGAGGSGFGGSGGAGMGGSGGDADVTDTDGADEDLQPGDEEEALESDEGLEEPEAPGAAGSEAEDEVAEADEDGTQPEAATSEADVDSDSSGFPWWLVAVGALILAAGGVLVAIFRKGGAAK